MQSSRLLLILLNVAGALSQSCDYVQNIPVKYTRLFSRRSMTAFLSECISDSSIGTNNVKSITIECRAAKLPELKENFISGMATLERIVIKSCDIAKIRPGAFVDLPKLTSINIKENHQLSHVPKGIFDNLPKLNSIELSLNNISTIEDEAFANLPKLSNIQLSKNNLKQMSRRWFTNTTNIKNFLIDSNRIEEVPENMFKGWTKAGWFVLSRNNISVIGKQAFKDTAQKVILLDLSGNCLKEVDVDSFPNELILELDFSGNLFNYIPGKFIRTVRVRNLNLIGNPFKCPCLTRIFETLTDEGAKVTCGTLCHSKCGKSATVPVCANPTVSPEVCVESVDEEVTNRTSEYMRQLGYQDLRDWTRKCLWL